MWHPNLKECGHLYLTDTVDGVFSVENIRSNLVERYGEEKGLRIFGVWFDSYRSVDIIDTGIYDCRSPDYTAAAQRSAELIGLPCLLCGGQQYTAGKAGVRPLGRSVSRRRKRPCAERGGFYPVSINTRFPVAVHALALIALNRNGERPSTSELIAKSAGTNPVVIRRILSQLKQAGLLESGPGKPETKLKKAAEEISLGEIYRAVQDREDLFSVHPNPSQQCWIGHNIHSTLEGPFETGAKRDGG